MVKQKNLTIFSSLALLVVLGAAGIQIAHSQNHNSESTDADVLPIKTIQASFVYDPWDINESVGLVDYVFVGQVVSNDGTEYRRLIPMENEDGTTRMVGVPYTIYTVQVLSNIKGNLRLDEPFSIVKHGGISQNHSEVWVYEDDCLPAEDGTYIFLAFAQQDGSLLISGPNSNILMDNATYQTIYENYVDAYEHEIIFERDRYTSIYEMPILY